MFGIELPPRALEILANVERYFGKSVQETVVEKWEHPSRSIEDVGQSTVTDDGTPVIRIDISVDSGPVERKKATIVHELMHLKQRTEGFPNIAFSGQTEFMDEYGGDFITLKEGMWTPILHYIFNPEIDQMGLDSSLENTKNFNEVRQRPVTGNESSLGLTLYYFRAAIELKNPQMLSEMKAWYIHNKWNGPLMAAERIAAVILTLKPRTPDEALTAMLECANSLLEGFAKLSILSREIITRGSYRQPLITYRVDRLK